MTQFLNFEAYGMFQPEGPSTSLETTTQFVQEATSEKKLKSDSIDRDLDVVCRYHVADFCKIAHFGSKISPANQSLWNKHAVATQIHQGDYTPAMQEIWTSGSVKNKIKTVEVLMKEHGALHAPFMLELSLLLYQDASKEQKKSTLENLSWPLMGAANFRCSQDINALAIPSVRYKKKIMDVYYTQLRKLIKKDLETGMILPEVNDGPLSSEITQVTKRPRIASKFPKELDYDPDSKEVNIVIKQIAQATLSESNLPNPRWIGTPYFHMSDEEVQRRTRAIAKIKIVEINAQS